MIRTVLASAVALVMSLGAAVAATVTFAPTPAVGFANPVATSWSGTEYTAVRTNNGLVDGVARSPWQDFSNTNQPYSSLTGEATFAFNSLSSVFSLVWGSPDTYNSLEFWLGGNMVDSVAGGFIQTNGGATTANGNLFNSLVTINTVSAFDTVVFKSTQAAFEWAMMSNVAPIPLPAGGLLLLGGLAGLAALRRRKAV